MFIKLRFIFYFQILILVFLCFISFSVNAAEDDVYYAPELNVSIQGLDFTESPIIINGDYITIPFLATYIYAFFKYSVGIAVLVAAIMLIYGGYLYLLSSTGIQVQNAKQKMIDAIVGMVIFLGAYVIIANINPNLLNFSGLTMLKTEQKLWGEAYPDSSIEDILGDSTVSSQQSFQSSTADQVLSEGEDRGGNKGCVVNPKYKPARAICTTVESCKCATGELEYDTSVYPKLSDLANFNEISNLTPEEQIKQYGLYFPKEGGGAYLIPEAKNALIKAGEIAKAQGYFLYVPVTTRPVEAHLKEWCNRMTTGNKNSGGLTFPGASPHNLGLAIDVNLGGLSDKSYMLRTLKIKKGKKKEYLKIDDKFANLLTVGGPLCDKKTNVNQVDGTVSMGIENSKILQKILAEAGWRRMCSEMWHYNYSGVYSIDCTECAFPPTPPHSLMKNCDVKYKP